MQNYTRAFVLCAGMTLITTTALAQETLRAEIEFYASGEGVGLIDTSRADFVAQYITNNIHSLGKTELAELIQQVIGLGGTITIGSNDQPRPIDPGQACLIEQETRQKIDEAVNGTRGLDFYFDRRENDSNNFGVKEGFGFWTEGFRFENVREYNVSGIKGFKVFDGITAEQYCQGDPECIREIGRNGAPALPQPHQAKQISCMGATITDPDLIGKISDTIEQTAQQKSDIAARAWGYQQYITGIRPEDLGIGASIGSAETDLGPVPSKAETEIEAIRKAYNESAVQIIYETEKATDFTPEIKKYGLQFVIQ